MLYDTPDIVQYISSNYSDAEKIVEIGIGAEDSIYKALKREMSSKILSVDIRSRGESQFDDIFKPDMEKYRGANLIYAIRPNPELIPALRKLAKKSGADLLIRPLSTDSHHQPTVMKLVNFGKAVLWVELNVRENDITLPKS